MTIVDWIKILSDLSEKEKYNLSLFCQEKQLQPWEILFNENDEASAMYLLKTWNIQISKDIQGTDKIIWQVHAEEILWEMALFWWLDKRMATARAIDECNLIVVLSFSIKELTNRYPELLEKIKTIINDRNIINQKLN